MWNVELFFLQSICTKQNHTQFLSSMEYHQQQLQKHCRVCGKRLDKTKGKPQTVYSCTQHTSDLSTYAGVEIGNSEDDHIFPQQMHAIQRLAGQNRQPKMEFLFPLSLAWNGPYTRRTAARYNHKNNKLINNFNLK